jgi:hypothetical protein
MNLLKKSIQKALSIKAMSEKSDAPEQAIHIKVPNEDEAFQAILNVTKLVVIEMQNKNNDYKEQYIVDPDLIEQLDRKYYRIKVLHIIKTEDGKFKCIALPAKTKNSWHVSNLEMLTQAETSPVTAKRDTIAKVYEAHLAADVEPIIITDEDVDQAYSNAFGKYEITSLDHLALVGKLKVSPIVDVVDEPEIELLDDTAALVPDLAEPDPLEELIEIDEIELDEEVTETSVPVSGSLEELQASLQPINDLKNEIDLEDIYIDSDDDLGLDDISIDDINIDELAV